jgi:hypothetical protein
MDLTALPSCPSMDQYQNQAKDLLEAFGSGDPEAVQCIRQYHPTLPGRANSTERDKLKDSEIRNAKVSLAGRRCREDQRGVVSVLGVVLVAEPPAIVHRRFSHTAVLRFPCQSFARTPVPRPSCHWR